MKTNMLIAIVAVVVVVGAVGAYVLMSGGSSSSSFSLGSDYTTDLNEEKLAIQGNANGDCTIDANDVTAINTLIADGEITYSANKDTYLANRIADANYDGKINSDDATYVQSMIDGTCTKLYYEGLTDQILSFNVTEKAYLVPIHRCYARTAIMLDNASDNISIVAGTNQLWEDEFKDACVNLANCVNVGTSGASTVNTETVMNLTNTYTDGRVVVLCGQNDYYCKDYESQFSGSVDIIRFITWEGSSMTGILTLGYLLDGVSDGKAWEQAQAFYTFYHKWADPIATAASSISEDNQEDTICTYVTNPLNSVEFTYYQGQNNNIRGSNQSDYLLFETAGADMANDWFVSKGSTAFAGNIAWDLESLAAGIQGSGEDLENLVVLCNMLLSSDTVTAAQMYETTANQVAQAFTGYIDSSVDIWVVTWNANGIPDIAELAIAGIITGVLTESIETIWGEYIALYGGTSVDLSTSNLAYGNLCLWYPTAVHTS